MRFELEIYQYVGLANILGWYLVFTDISVSAKIADFISLSASVQ